MIVDDERSTHSFMIIPFDWQSQIDDNHDVAHVWICQLPPKMEKPNFFDSLERKTTKFFSLHYYRQNEFNETKITKFVLLIFICKSNIS